MPHSRASKNRPVRCTAPLTLTPRQLQILRLIHEYRSSNGCSPTMQEMAQSLCVNKVTIFEHVETLVRKKLLQRIPHKARSLTLNPRLNLKALFGQVVQYSPEPSAGIEFSASFPLAGQIAAGVPLEAVENHDNLDLNCLFPRSDSVFALRVRGDSMIEEQIRSGDYVLVQKTSVAKDGQIVVALLENGEATLKIFFHHPKGFRLQPANPDYPPLFVDSVNIQGVVIGVIRRV